MGEDNAFISFLFLSMLIYVFIYTPPFISHFVYTFIGQKCPVPKLKTRLKCLNIN